MEEDPDLIEGKKKKGKKKEITLERMRIALEKLQLARAKITFTLIALGFGSYKVFYDRVERGLKPLLSFPNGRDIAIALIIAGFLILLSATIQHRKSLTKLRAKYPGMQSSMSLLFSYFTLALSLALLVIVSFRL